MTKTRPLAQANDDVGRTPEDFVRAFLIAYRQYELEANEILERTDAEEATRSVTDPLDSGGQEVFPEQVVDGLYRALLQQFATPKLLAKHLQATLQSPPRANAASTTFIGVEAKRGRVVVRTSEAGPLPQYLPPIECEYRVELVDGVWRLDDRREKAYDGRWIRLVL